MLAVYSPSFTKRKCLRMCNIPHKNVLRRHLNVGANDCGVKTSVVFVQSFPGYSVSRCLKTAEGVYVWIRHQSGGLTAFVYRAVEQSCYSLKKQSTSSFVASSCVNFCLSRRIEKSCSLLAVQLLRRRGRKSPKFSEIFSQRNNLCPCGWENTTVRLGLGV